MVRSKARSRSWLITIQNPEKEHYESILKGTHVYATWKTLNDILTVVLYYSNAKMKPDKV